MMKLLFVFALVIGAVAIAAEPTTMSIDEAYARLQERQAKRLAEAATRPATQPAVNRTGAPTAQELAEREKASAKMMAEAATRPVAAAKKSTKRIIIGAWSRREFEDALAGMSLEDAAGAMGESIGVQYGVVLDGAYEGGKRYHCWHQWEPNGPIVGYFMRVNGDHIVTSFTLEEDRGGSVEMSGGRTH